jgi:hypothetical protein
MVLKGKRHVLSYSERIVECCMLKQESHLLSDCPHLIHTQPGNVFSVNTNRSRVGSFEANDKPQQHALAGAAASQYGQGFSSAHTQTNFV